MQKFYVFSSYGDTGIGLTAGIVEVDISEGFKPSSPTCILCCGWFSLLLIGHHFESAICLPYKLTFP